ncbi:MAG: hypothetical protein JNK76_11185 [Planctomycetales bacterium]|nr:hypothetical protein [Planctomycetales bacterium]MBN8625647.1 hypothetical protein [Planctomycetota bacterium]
MQAAELVELAAVVARQAPTMLRAREDFRVFGIEDYWSASKCRFDRWGRTLGRLRRGETPLFDDVPGNKTLGGQSSGTVRGLLEEILASEVLTRVWTAVVAAFDRRREMRDNEIVVRSVYVGHLEMRQRVLQLLVGGPGLDTGEAVVVNRLRRRAELWTDLLLAPLAAAHAIEEFAFEVERLRSLADEYRRPRRREESSVDAVRFASSTLQSAVAHALSTPSPNADLNAQVAGAILGALPAEQFDSCGVLRSLWMMRLSTTADDTQRLLDELFHHTPSTPSTTASRRFG